MVDFAKAHHPSNCLALNNRNRFGDGATTATAKTKDFARFCTDTNNVRDGGGGMGTGTSTSNDKNNGIDSIGCDEGGGGGQSNCKWQHRRTSRRCTINGNAVLNDYRRVNVQIDHGNSIRKKAIQDGAGMWRHRVRTIVANSCNLSVSVILCAAISLLLLNIDVIKAEPQQTTEQQCEPKVLEETPPDPVSIFNRW